MNKIGLFICSVMAAFAGCSNPVAPTTSLTWLSSLAEAKEKAQTEKKHILVNFTGSDWCTWCHRLRREVFTRAEFADYASNNLVLVEIDFPHGKPQSPEVKRANEILAQRYQVEGLPTVLLMDQYGRVVGRSGYVRGGPRAFLTDLQSMANNKPSAEPEQHIEVDYKGGTGLHLKGISGPPEKRLALINNTTISAGETTTIRANDQRLKVHCLEIRDKSVVVEIDGRTQATELRLSGRL